jgi:hypothetical protein
LTTLATILLVRERVGVACAHLALVVVLRH